MARALKTPRSRKARQAAETRRQTKRRYLDRAAKAGDPWVTKGLSWRRSMARRLDALADAAGCKPAQLVAGWVVAAEAGKPPSASAVDYCDDGDDEWIDADTAHLPHLFRKNLLPCLSHQALGSIDETYGAAIRANRRLTAKRFLSDVIRRGLAAPADDPMRFGPDRTKEAAEVLVDDRAADIAAMSVRYRCSPLAVVDLMLALFDDIANADEERVNERVERLLEAYGEPQG